MCIPLQLQETLRDQGRVGVRVWDQSRTYLRRRLMSQSLELLQSEHHQELMRAMQGEGDAPLLRRGDALELGTA